MSRWVHSCPTGDVETIEQPLPDGNWSRSYAKLYARRLKSLEDARRSGSTGSLVYFQTRYHPSRMSLSQLQRLARRLAQADVERAINERKWGEGRSRRNRGVAA